MFYFLLYFGFIDVAQSRFARVGPYTLVGAGTSIGDYSFVINSTIGDNCTIGRNVSIEGCYIWNNVTIQDNCKLKHAIVCDGAILKAGAVLQPGVILTFKVMLGEDIEVPAYSKISLLHQPTTQDSDEELEYADSSHGIVENPCNLFASLLVGVSGAGVLWSIGENLQEDEWKHSIAPIPAEKLGGIIAALADAEASQDLGTQQTSEGVKANIERDVDEDGNSVVDDDVDLKTVQFDKEVEETFARAVVEGVEQDHKCVLFVAEAIFYQILQILYDQDLVTEDAIMSWASEKEGAEESDKVFVNQCEAFIQVCMWHGI
ncbi:Translation initiation factor eIF-2B subunit epsilon [Nymphaea thermarum]|nr:Translation initiation factor eIF-2B subunit epsilon [Nymphaea thermarum]